VLKIEKNESNFHDDAKAYRVKTSGGNELLFWFWQRGSNGGGVSILREPRADAVFLTATERKQLAVLLINGEPEVEANA